MPQLSKSDARDLVRQLIDDPAGKFWPRQRLDLLFAGCLDELWSQLLDEFSYLTSVEETVTRDAAGGVLTTTQLSSRFYRAQRVMVAGREYDYVHPREVNISGSEVVSGPDYCYTVLHDGIWALPLEPNTAITIRYSHLPEPFTSLDPASDSPDSEDDDDVLTIPWPDGHHMAYIYDVAAKAMEKGNRKESDRLTRRAEHSLLRLKQYLRKQHVGPVMPWYGDDVLDWGSV